MEDPLSAASRLNGNAEVDVELKDGGSIREKGAEVRRVDFNAANFFFGDLPAGAVIGARGTAMLASKGVANERGDEEKVEEGGGIEFLAWLLWMLVLVLKLEVNGFIAGLSNVLPLVFFDGESNMAGSMFSLPKSSYVEGSWARLLEVVMLMVLHFIMPFFAFIEVDLCAITPSRNG